MSEAKTYNFSKPEEFSQFFGFVSYLKEKGSTVELKEIKQTRSYLQNKAMHLYFQFCADALNESGDYFQYVDYKNVSAEIPWDGIMFKQYWIKPIIKVLYDIDSTTKLKTNEIDQIIDIISKRFAENGLSVSFPSSFNQWIEKSQII